MSAFDTRFKTTWIVALIAVALGLWDLYARNYPGGTVSEVMLSSARHNPILPFLFGVLCGHLFWPQIDHE